MKAIEILKSKKALIAASVVLAGVIAFVIVKRVTNKKKIEEINKILDGWKTGASTISGTEYNKLPSGAFPLKYGDKNRKVFVIQQQLNKNYGTKVDLNGIFGDQLYAALNDKYWTIPSFGTTMRTLSAEDAVAISKPKN